MKRFKCLILIVLIIPLNIFITGCWDKIELENRAFVLGIGLDKSEKPGEVEVTYQIALPSEMYGEGGKKGENTTWNITTSTPVAVRAEKLMSMKLDKVIDLEHVMVLIIGEELAREGIGKHIDFFIRDINMRRRVEVLISQEKAKQTFDVCPPIARSTSNYIANIIDQNENNSHRVTSKINLLQIVKSLRENSDFILAMITSGEEDVTISGAAIFKEDRMVGTINSNDIRRIKWMKGDISRGTMIFNDVGEMKGAVVFEISNGKTKIKPIIKGEDLSFNVSIYVEGDVAETESFNFLGTTEKDFTNLLEKEVEKKIEEECIEIMERAQKQSIDFLSYSNLVRSYNYKWMEEHKDNWRDIFKEATLNLDVNVDVRRVGLVK